MSGVKKRYGRLFAAVNGILVLLAVICAVFFYRISGTLDSVRAADRWRGENEMRFAQIACFLPEDDSKAVGDIIGFRQTVDQKLIDASLAAAEGERLYTDAYSGSAKLQVSGDKGSAEVKAIGVGGDFFLFHPLRLRSGSYLSSQDLMQDRVILDEELAWKLFGGYDVAGMSVTIDGLPYYVAGVVSREDDFATEKAYLDGAGMFISYSAFDALTEGSAGITCYEIVMPDMISGFSHSIVKESFPVGMGDLVENSSRYSFSALLQTAGQFGIRSMRSNGVIYPYWENAVRLTEDYLSLLLIGMLVLLLCPVLTLIVILIKQLVRLSRLVKTKVPAIAEQIGERRKEKKYAKAGK